MIYVRWLIKRDMPEVLRIEQQSFEHAWTEKDFLSCLRHRNVIGMVAEQGEKVVGFMIYELHKAKLHVVKLGVAPEHRRQGHCETGKRWDTVSTPSTGGIGTLLLRELISKLAAHRRTAITVDVRETNLGAQLFFKASGFEAVRVLRGWYEDTGEDAYRMGYCIRAEASTPGVSEDACAGVSTKQHYSEEE